MPAGAGGANVTPGVGSTDDACPQPVNTAAAVSMTPIFAQALITCCLFFAQALITCCLFFAQALITDTR
jgi:hypothetical protein